MSDPVISEVETVEIPARPLTVPEVSKLTGLQERHLRNMCNSGKVKLCPGRPMRIPVEEVRRLNSPE